MRDIDNETVAKNVRRWDYGDDFDETMDTEDGYEELEQTILENTEEYVSAGIESAKQGEE